MKKSTIWLIAGVMGFAFIGLLYLQTHYVHIILTNQEEQFRESVKRALYQVSHDLEIEETTKNINDPYLNFNKKYLRKDGKSSPKIQLGVDPIDISSGFGKNDITKTSKAIQDAFQNNYFYYQDLLDEVIQKAKKGSNKPLDERIDMKNIDDYIKTELENNNLNLPYTFSVSDHQKNIVYQSSNFHPETGKVYSQILFPQDSPNKLYVLQVIFPTQQKYMMDSVRFIIPSLIFTVVLLIVFIFTLYKVFRQKRLSEMKNDFINNMTHELKTPVASISLAAQTLNDTELSHSPQLMNHAKTVISEESKRLGFLVEKVLQMSLFEDGSVQFKMVELDANDLIAGVANTFALRVEKAGGALDIELNALESTILVDKMHFTNVLFNLMENAVKYRKEDVPLQLLISTDNIGDKIQITVQDNGVGIKKENLKKIFDRFYRVHTGNLHDVKGFGLGLAYVRRIIHELDGTIKAESEYEQGTKFIITLPYVKN